MHKDDNLPPYCAVVRNSRSLNFLDPSGPAWPVTGVLYLSMLWVKLLGDYNKLIRKVVEGSRLNVLL